MRSHSSRCPPDSAAIAARASSRRKARLRHDRADPRRGAEPLAGDGPHQLAERRLRPAADRRARHHAGERLGDEEVRRVGPRQRAPRDVGLRQGMVARPLQRAHGRAAGAAAHRVPGLVDARHQGTGHRRRRARPDRHRSGLREVPRQAGGQDRPDAAGARRCAMLEGPIILRMGDKEFEEAATTPIPARAAGRAAAAGGEPRRRDGARRRRTSLRQTHRSSSTRPRAWSRSSIAAATAIMAAGGSDLSWQQQHPDGGTIFPTGAGSRGADAGRACRRVTLAVEHYNRMVRILDEERAGEGGAEHRDEVLRRDDAERLQHDRRDSGHRSGAQGRSRAARRALRLGRRGNRRHRQRDRQSPR